MEAELLRGRAGAESAAAKGEKAASPRGLDPEPPEVGEPPQDDPALGDEPPRRGRPDPGDPEELTQVGPEDLDREPLGVAEGPGELRVPVEGEVAVGVEL